MNTNGYIKRLEKRFSELSILYHKQVVMGKSPKELLLLVLNIKSILSQIKSLRKGNNNGYVMN
jgi:hypothetical protein